jgi:hypothetical protein
MVQTNYKNNLFSLQQLNCQCMIRLYACTIHKPVIVKSDLVKHPTATLVHRLLRLGRIH